ncbi:MAG: sulfatase-like hydrolase/transferase [Flavobacteriales bacterium]|nr:sulfatase-like hydrolase/transferase [Flavobacteriales bacterium]
MSILKILLREGLLLLILFTLGRTLFLLGHGDLDLLGDSLSVFSHAFRLDIATIAQCISIIFLSLLLRPLFKGRITFLISKYYSILLAIVISMIYAGEIILYHEWGTKLSYKVFAHLSNPAEVFQTGSIGQMAVFALVMLVMLGTYFTIRRTKFLGFGQLQNSIVGDLDTKKKWVISFLKIVVVTPVLMLAIRGGSQPIPINLSNAYFSDKMAFNDAAVNSLWNLGYSISENLGNFNDQNPFQYMDDEAAQAIVDNVSLLVIKSNDYPNMHTIAPAHIFTSEKPNIVLLILESWSVNVISSMSGPKDITPNFDQLVSEGLLFTQFYASGYTSDLAMPAIFSSYHALPIASIVTQPSKVKDLPSLARHLVTKGYSTSFYFGGQLHYGNIKSYLMLQDFQTIVEENDLSDDFPRGRLGIHDEYMLNVHAAALAEAKQPFFSTLFTLSSHSPYDMPVASSIAFDDEHNEYLNSVHYTDSCLGTYFSWVREQDFYDNTIFIITGDHGHYAPSSGNKFSKEFNNIPLLFYGKPLHEYMQGQQIDQIGSQVDLAPTLLSQLDIDPDKFEWGKNLMNQGCPEFAYYSGPNSVSWIRPYGYFSYANHYEQYMHLELRDSTRKEELITEGKAYAQMVFKDYIER